MDERKNGRPVNGSAPEPDPARGSPDDLLRHLEAHAEDRDTWMRAGVLAVLNIWKILSEVQQVPIPRDAFGQIEVELLPDPEDPDGEEGGEW